MDNSRIACARCITIGKCIKANRDDAAPGLPNIPAQAGFIRAVEVLRVPADELNVCFDRINKRMAALLKAFPDSALIADYTGGTKTMTAALAMAAIEHERVQLHLVTGRRSDLVRVRDGSEAGIWASVEGIRLRKRISESLCFWQHYAYAQASDGLHRIPMPEQAPLRGALLRARDLSDAFAAWELLQTLLPDSPAGLFFSEQKKQFLDIVQIRNHSILAHGFDPISHPQWEKIYAWMLHRFLPMQEQAFARVNFNSLPPQLPNQFSPVK